MWAAASWSSADDVIFFASSEERPSTLRLATEPTAQPTATRPAIGFFGAIFIALTPAPANRPAAGVISTSAVSSSPACYSSTRAAVRCAATPWLVAPPSRPPQAWLSQQAQPSPRSDSGKSSQQQPQRGKPAARPLDGPPLCKTWHSTEVAVAVARTGSDEGRIIHKLRLREADQGTGRTRADQRHHQGATCQPRSVAQRWRRARKRGHAAGLKLPGISTEGGSAHRSSRRGRSDPPLWQPAGPHAAWGGWAQSPGPPGPPGQRRGGPRFP